MSKICKISKASIALLLIALFIISWGNTISYANDVSENTEADILFINFINEAYSNIDKLLVRNQDGEDVTDYFINVIDALFEKKDYKAIQKIIVNEKLVPSIENTVVPSIETTDVNINNNDLLRASRTQYCYEIISHSYNLQKQTQSWEVMLSGTIISDLNTGKIYSASGPALSLYDDSGINSQLSARIISASTGNSIESSKVKFYATYSIEARVKGAIEGMDLSPYEIVRLGTHQAQFYGYPE